MWGDVLTNCNDWTCVKKKFYQFIFFFTKDLLKRNFSYNFPAFPRMPKNIPNKVCFNNKTENLSTNSILKYTWNPWIPASLTWHNSCDDTAHEEILFAGEAFLRSPEHHLFQRNPIFYVRPKELVNSRHVTRIKGLLWKLGNTNGSIHEHLSNT